MPIQRAFSVNFVCLRVDKRRASGSASMRSKRLFATNPLQKLRRPAVTLSRPFLSHTSKSASECVGSTESAEMTTCSYSYRNTQQTTNTFNVGNDDEIFSISSQASVHSHQQPSLAFRRNIASKTRISGYWQCAQAHHAQTGGARAPGHVGEAEHALSAGNHGAQAGVGLETILFMTD